MNGFAFKILHVLINLHNTYNQFSKPICNLYIKEQGLAITMVTYACNFLVKESFTQRQSRLVLLNLKSLLDKTNGKILYNSILLLCIQFPNKINSKNNNNNKKNQQMKNLNDQSEFVMLFSFKFHLHILHFHLQFLDEI